MKSQKEEKGKAILAAKIIKMKLKFSLNAETSRSSDQNELSNFITYFKQANFITTTPCSIDENYFSLDIESFKKVFESSFSKMRPLES